MDTKLSIPWGTLGVMTTSIFEGGDRWFLCQSQRISHHPDNDCIDNSPNEEHVAFDRQKFISGIMKCLDGDVNDGFVIGLKRKRDFATQVCQEYKHYSDANKLDMMLALAVDLGLQDLSSMVHALPSLPRTHLVLNVIAAALGFARKSDATISKSIKKGLVPIPEQFFMWLAVASGGPQLLLQLRCDLRTVMEKFSVKLTSEEKDALEYLDIIMRDLFATQAGVRFQRITVESEKVVACVLQNERVHAMRSWTDLERRLLGRNRYCFGLFAVTMPDEPLAFVEVVLTDHLCHQVAEILDGTDELVGLPSHIIFYSISNANNGLRGLNIASHLLFLTIEKLRSLYPSCHTFATLSPVPGFSTWFIGHLSRPGNNHNLVSLEQVRRFNEEFGVSPLQCSKWLLKRLNSFQWHTDSAFTSAIKSMMEAACARYLLFGRRGEKMLDPVANFHLQNGAQVEQINFPADTSSKALRNSFGLMVNYRYCLKSIDSASLSYKRNALVASSVAVARVVWSSKSLLLDEIVRQDGKCNIPLYARVFAFGEQLCLRGSLPMAVYFISYGRVRVESCPPHWIEGGSCYGQEQLLRQEPHPYSLVSEGEVHVLLLLKSDVETLVKNSPRLQSFGQGAAMSKL